MCVVWGGVGGWGGVGCGGVVFGLGCVVWCLGCVWVVLCLVAFGAKPLRPVVWSISRRSMWWYVVPYPSLFRGGGMQLARCVVALRRPVEGPQL